VLCPEAQRKIIADIVRTVLAEVHKTLAEVDGEADATGGVDGTIGSDTGRAFACGDAGGVDQVGVGPFEGQAA